jgi:hypothetical protein
MGTSTNAGLIIEGTPGLTNPVGDADLVIGTTKPAQNGPWNIYDVDSPASYFKSAITIGNNIAPTTAMLSIATSSTATTSAQLSLLSARTAIVAGNLIGGIDFKSDNSNITAPGIVVAGIQAQASQTHTASNLGTDLVFYNTPLNSTTEHEAVRILANGQVGIGTSSPSQPLSVNGTIYATGGIEFGDGTTENTAPQSQWANTGSSIYYNSGDVGIGTAAPTGTLQIGGLGASLVLGGYNSDTSPFTIKGFPAAAPNEAGSNITFDAANGNGSGGSGSFIWQTAAPNSEIASSPITFDASSNAETAGAASLTFTQTIGTLTNGVLIVDVAYNSQVTNDISSVTFGGQNLTELADASEATTESTEIWYLLDPPAGSGSVVITTNGASLAMTAGAQSFSNVLQIGTFNTPIVNTGTALSASNLTPTLVNDVVIDAFSRRGGSTNNATMGAGDGQHFVFDTNTGTGNNNVEGSGSYVVATSTSVTTMWNWTTTARDYAYISVAMHNAGGSASDRLTNAMTLTASGFLGIGTITPYAPLDIWGPDTASTSAFIVSNAASTTVFSVYDNGNTAYSGSIFQSSDKRLKTDVTQLDASTSLAEIEGLTPVSYIRIDQPEEGTNLGFLAQAVQQVFPDLVSTTSPTTLTPDGTLTLNYTGLIAPIVASIQLLASEIDDLAQSITTQVLTATTGNFNQICLQTRVGPNVCITGDQLNALLQQGDASAAASPRESDLTSNANATTSVEGAASITDTSAISSDPTDSTDTDTGTSSVPLTASSTHTSDD